MGQNQQEALAHGLELPAGRAIQFRGPQVFKLSLSAHGNTKVVRFTVQRFTVAKLHGSTEFVEVRSGANIEVFIATPRFLQPVQPFSLFNP